MQISMEGFLIQDDNAVFHMDSASYYLLPLQWTNQFILYLAILGLLYLFKIAEQVWLENLFIVSLGIVRFFSSRVLLCCAIPMRDFSCSGIGYAI